MGISQTIVFYFVFGAGVAVAVALSTESLGRAERLLRTVTAFFFWPLYVPLLLQGHDRKPAPAEPRLPAMPADDPLTAAINEAETQLDSALGSLDGWAEDVLSREQHRFAELRAAWRLQAAQIRQLDGLLNRPDFAAATAADAMNSGIAENAARLMDTERARQSELARRDNIKRLQAVRDRLYGDLAGTLAWVRELVTMIHLAKYTGAPASRAEELVAQIAAAIEGLSEATQACPLDTEARHAVLSDS